MEGTPSSVINCDFMIEGQKQMIDYTVLPTPLSVKTKEGERGRQDGVHKEGTYGAMLVVSRVNMVRPAMLLTCGQLATQHYAEEGKIV